MTPPGQPEFQRLSPVVRLFCALMAVSGILLVPLGISAIERHGFSFHYLLLIASGPVSMLAFGYAAFAGRFPTKLPGSRHIYVRVSRDKLRLRVIESGAEVEIIPEKPFTTSRLLVGDFGAAERALKEGVKKASGGGWLTPSPAILMHATEMTEGGLSEIETRVLQELAIGAGAMKAKVWSGPELTDAQALEKLA